MTDPPRLHRPLSALADEIQNAWTGSIPRDVRVLLQELRQLAHIEDEGAYLVVAELRKALGGWRTPVARRIKAELEVVLTHFRADH